jgi:hypothetical protein
MNYLVLLYAPYVLIYCVPGKCFLSKKELNERKKERKKKERVN